jgi:hypothetical protein
MLYQLSYIRKSEHSNRKFRGWRRIFLFFLDVAANRCSERLRCVNIVYVTNDQGRHRTTEPKRCPSVVGPSLDVSEVAERHRIDLRSEGTTIGQQDTAIGEDRNTVVGKVFATDHCANLFAWFECGSCGDHRRLGPFLCS